LTPLCPTAAAICLFRSSPSMLSSWTVAPPPLCMVQNVAVYPLSTARSTRSRSTCPDPCTLLDSVTGTGAVPESQSKTLVMMTFALVTACASHRIHATTRQRVMGLVACVTRKVCGIGQPGDRAEHLGAAAIDAAEGSATWVLRGAQTRPRRCLCHLGRAAITRAVDLCTARRRLGRGLRSQQFFSLCLDGRLHEAVAAGRHHKACSGARARRENGVGGRPARVQRPARGGRGMFMLGCMGPPNTQHDPSHHITRSHAGLM
jgi:hypothetical protein